MLFATLDVIIRPLPPHEICVQLSGHLSLAGTASGPLARHDRPVQEKFSAPDTPRLTALKRAGEAHGPPRAPVTERFGALHVLR